MRIGRLAFHDLAAAADRASVAKLNDDVANLLIGIRLRVGGLFTHVDPGDERLHAGIPDGVEVETLHRRTAVHQDRRERERNRELRAEARRDVGAGEQRRHLERSHVDALDLVDVEPAVRHRRKG
jgi:hypothetical protein